MQQRDYPALIACRVSWDKGQRTVAGALFRNGEVRLVAYDKFAVDAYPDGYVLVLEDLVFQTLVAAISGIRQD